MSEASKESQRRGMILVLLCVVLPITWIIANAVFGEMGLRVVAGIAVMVLCGGVYWATAVPSDDQEA